MMVWEGIETIWVFPRNVKTLLTKSYLIGTRYAVQHGEDHIFGGKLSTNERQNEIEIEASNIFDKINVDESWSWNKEDVERKEETVPSFYLPELESTYEVNMKST